jgi:segregation and condensation protein A
VKYLERMSQENLSTADRAASSITDGRVAGFSLHLSNFEGPFDLLLQLISRHKMDITEVALGAVTDEFIAFGRGFERSGGGLDLEKTTEFLLVAATLLDLKAAKLLPSGEVDDESDLALLEARDLLFARLLQYRAFKEISAIFSQRIDREEKFFARLVALEPHFAQLLPEVMIGVGAQRFAAIANRVLAPKTAPIFNTDHLHQSAVSVAEQAAMLVEHLRRTGRATFRAIVANAETTLVVVARFLALLELYREEVVRFEQMVCLGELQITWIGSSTGEVMVSGEFDLPVQSEDKADNVQT